MVTAAVIAIVTWATPLRTSAAADLDCGPTVPKPTGGYWRCTFAEEFSADGLDSLKWTPQLTASDGFRTGPACFVNSPRNIVVSGGTLKLTARRESEPFVCKSPLGDFSTRYTTAAVSTWERFSQTYGRFEIRAKLPTAKTRGLQSALWLWPQNAKRYGDWPASGEIDIAETYSRYPDRAIPFIHYRPASPDENETNNYCMIDDLGAFHSYVAEWTPSAITIKYDDRTCLIDHWKPARPLVKPSPFDQPFIVVLTQALGQGANAFDPATTLLPATTEVDYVRVWD